jgi:hypothetical protein
MIKLGWIPMTPVLHEETFLVRFGVNVLEESPNGIMEGIAIGRSREGINCSSSKSGFIVIRLILQVSLGNVEFDEAHEKPVGLGIVPVKTAHSAEPIVRPVPPDVERLLHRNVFTVEGEEIGNAPGMEKIQAPRLFKLAKAFPRIFGARVPGQESLAILVRLAAPLSSITFIEILFTMIALVDSVEAIDVMYDAIKHWLVLQGFGRHRIPFLRNHAKLIQLVPMNEVASQGKFKD